MKKLNITYDTAEIENGEKIIGETCYSVKMQDALAEQRPRLLRGHRYGPPRVSAPERGNPAGPEICGRQHQALRIGEGGLNYESREISRLPGRSDRTEESV